MIDAPIPMPSRLQRLAAFGGFVAYLLTQAQVDAHRKQRAQLVAAMPMPAAGFTNLPTGTDVNDGHRHGEDTRPHIHDDDPRWPHTHDG